MFAARTGKAYRKLKREWNATPRNLRHDIRVAMSAELALAGPSAKSSHNNTPGE